MATDTIAINTDISHSGTVQDGAQAPVVGTYYSHLSGDIADAGGLNLGTGGAAAVRCGCATIASIASATQVTFPLKVFVDAFGSTTLTMKLLPTGSNTAYGTPQTITATDASIDDTGGAARTITFSGLSLSQSELDGLEIQFSTDGSNDWFIGNITGPALTVTYTAAAASTPASKMGLGIGLGVS